MDKNQQQGGRFPSPASVPVHGRAAVSEDDFMTQQPEALAWEETQHIS